MWVCARVLTDLLLQSCLLSPAVVQLVVDPPQVVLQPLQLAREQSLLALLSLPLTLEILVEIEKSRIQVTQRVCPDNILHETTYMYMYTHSSMYS